MYRVIFLILFRRITKPLCTTQGIQKVAVTVVCRCYSKSSWSERFWCFFFFSPRCHLIRADARKHSEGAELLMPSGSRRVSFSSLCGKICNFKEGSPRCRPGAEVALCWLIPVSALANSALLIHTPFHRAQRRATGGSLRTLRDRDVWETGKRPDGEGKKQARVQEKRSPPSTDVHSSAFLYPVLTFSLVLPF